MIDDVIEIAGGIAKLTKLVGDLFDKYEDRSGIEAEFAAYLTHLHSEAEIRKRLRGELVPDTDPAPAPEFDPLPDPWSRESPTKVEP